MSSTIVGRSARSAAAAILFLVSFAALAQEDTPPPNPDQAPPPPADASGTPPPAETPVVPVAPEQNAAAPAAPAAQNATELDKIEVTGSRLKRTDYESAQPVVSISREDIERTGLTDISQILRQLTVAGNNSLTTQQARFSITLGETNLDLRNLGSTHTLLLVNGRRWVTGLVSTQPSASDFNTIPLSVVERIEVLKDGASAIYGSDAIGGVVNIITRKDFEGFGVDYQLGNYVQQGDGTNQHASVTWGASRPGRNVIVNLSYTNQGAAPNENRALTAWPSLITRNSPVTTRGTFSLVNPTSANTTEYVCPNLQGGIVAGASPDPTVGGAANQTGIIPAGVVLCTLERNASSPSTSNARTDYHQANINSDPNVAPEDIYNRFADGTLTEPSTRTALYTQFNQDLLDHLSFNFEGLYNRRKSTSVGQNGYLAGGDLAPGSSANAGHGWLAYIPSTNADNPFGQDIGMDDSCTDQAAPTCTHLGTGAGIWRIRQERGLNNFNNTDAVDTVRLGTGLRGDLDVLGLAFSWEGGYIFGRNQIDDRSTTARYDKEREAIDCSACPYHLDLFHGSAGLTQAAVDYVSYQALTHNQNRQDIAYLDASGELPSIRFLAGPIAMATGLEYRRDEYSTTVDPLLNQHLLFFLNNAVDTAGKTYAREGYVEFGLPLLKDLPAAQALDLDIAGRYSEYPTFGNVTTYKGGLRWKPLDDLLLRSTYSTGFRAPNVGELFLSPAQSYDPLTDPCPSSDPTTQQNCTTDGAAGAGSGTSTTPYDLWQGNLNLKPEKSKNLTYGLVFSPHWIPDLNVNLDFYDIEVDNFITIGLGQYFLDSCYTQARPGGAKSPYCDYIHRDSSGNLTFIDTPYFNYAKIKTSGIDGGVDYILPLPDLLGRFKIALDASYLKRYDTFAPQPGQADQISGLVGTDTGQFSGFPRWKAGTQLTWKRELYTASWSTRMAYQMTESCTDLLGSEAAFGVCSSPQKDENVLKTVYYHNLQFGRELPGFNADITLGVNNVLNQDPPISRSSIGLYWYNYDPNQYEVPGRFAYLRTSFKF